MVFEQRRKNLAMCALDLNTIEGLGPLLLAIGKSALLSAHQAFLDLFTVGEFVWNWLKKCKG